MHDLGGNCMILGGDPVWPGQQQSNGGDGLLGWWASKNGSRRHVAVMA